MGAQRTRRQELEDLLREGTWTVRDLAAHLGRPIRDVESDLSHVLRSRGRGAFAVEPARCPRCEFVFAKRSRLTAPSRCPRCKEERIDPPAVRMTR